MVRSITCFGLLLLLLLLPPPPPPPPPPPLALKTTNQNNKAPPPKTYLVISQIQFVLGILISVLGMYFIMFITGNRYQKGIQQYRMSKQQQPPQNARVLTRGNS
jgi:hypothetical protein